MVQQGVVAVAVAVVLTACAALFAALTPAEARRELYEAQTLATEAPSPVPTFPVSDCWITKDCSREFAVAMITNTTINGIDCCKSIIRNGDDCFQLALYYSYLGKPKGSTVDIFEWGHVVWDHCVSIA